MTFQVDYSSQVVKFFPLHFIKFYEYFTYTVVVFTTQQYRFPCSNNRLLSKEIYALLPRIYPFSTEPI
jgi:hypothetical protein